jgi:hypothetical protein
MRTMRIGINATFMNEQPTGLGVFTREISARISGKVDGTAVFSPVPLQGVTTNHLYRVPYSIKGALRFSNNLSRALYINTVLPLLCTRKDIEVLFCPMVEFPFLPLVPLVVHIHGFGDGHK